MIFVPAAHVAHVWHVDAFVLVENVDPVTHGVHVLFELTVH